METIPVAAVRLGINFDTYEDVARNIIRMKAVSKLTRQEIIDRANNKSSLDTRLLALILIENMADDREVYKLAELDYGRGPPEGEALFTTAVVDYLLRHRDSIPAKAF
jgi:hypothetical protein